VADRPALLVAVMVSMSLIVRIATILWPSTINWDENTFLTVAQRLAVGELPFVTTLDNKPPLLPLQQAVPFLLGWSEPWQIRLLLAVLIGITAALVARAVLVAGGTSRGAVLAGFVLIVGASLSPAGGASMSHHNPNLLLAVLMLIALKKEQDRKGWEIVAVGALAAAMTLTRTNYAFPAAAVLVTMLILSATADRTQKLIRMSAGGLAVVIAVVIPYASVGGLTNLRYGLFDVLFGPGGRAATGGTLPAIPFWLPPIIILSVLLAVAARGSQESVQGGRVHSARPARHDAAMLVPLVAMIGMVVSLALHESVLDHYAGLLIVPLAIQAGLAIRGESERSSEKSGSEGRLRVAATAGAAAASAIALLFAGTAGIVPTGDPSAAVNREDEVVRELAARLGVNPGRVWALDHHYVYWRLGLAPSNPIVTQPSTLNVETFVLAVPLFREASVPSSPFATASLLLDESPRYLVSSAALDEDYLRTGMSSDELERLRGRILTEWPEIWTSSDGRVAIRECPSCG
jgi:4-amino-4-deoxy-L-arabinose transferase-like glycosyltransferase